MTAPLLAPGYLLLRDAVSTPRSYLSDAALGLSEAAPRALPQDFAVALASHVIDGGVVVKLLLIAGLWLAGWGAARLADVVLPDAGSARPVRRRDARDLESLCRRTAAAGALEPAGRLRLPAVGGGGGAAAARAATGDWWPAGVLDRAGGADADGADARGGRRAGVLRRAGRRAGPDGACAAVSPRRGGARRAAVAGRARWSPGRCRRRRRPGCPQFAARAEPGLGTLGSLAGLGGIWNGQAVPDSRTTLFARRRHRSSCSRWWRWACRRRCAARPRVPLLVLAAVAVVAARADGDGSRAGRAWRPSIRAVPGPRRAARRAEVGGAGACPATRWRARRRSSRCGAGCRRSPRRRCAALALVAVLPDLAWGVGGQGRPRCATRRAGRRRPR